MVRYLRVFILFLMLIRQNHNLRHPQETHTQSDNSLKLFNPSDDTRIYTNTKNTNETVATCRRFDVFEGSILFAISDQGSVDLVHERDTLLDQAPIFTVHKIQALN